MKYHCAWKISTIFQNVSSPLYQSICKFLWKILLLYFIKLCIHTCGKEKRTTLCRVNDIRRAFWTIKTWKFYPANNEITRFHILTIHRSRIPKTLLLSIRSSRRLEASLWHVSSILIPRGHGWCVEDRGESRNSFTNLEQGKAMARYREMARFRDNDSNSKPMDQSVRDAILEQLGRKDGRRFDGGGISLGWPPRGLSHDPFGILEL